MTVKTHINVGTIEHVDHGKTTLLWRDGRDRPVALR